MGYAAKVLLDSISPIGIRLTTLEVTFPRIVLADFNTHRMLSRNGASSRAIPVAKRIAVAETDPFIPEAFGRNQRGMQAETVLEDADHEAAEVAWRAALADAICHAKTLERVGVHKQLANRILEPFIWHTAIVSATDWDNYYALRCHAAAQPELQRAARMMRDAMARSNPKPLRHGEWHMPMTHDAAELLAEGFTEPDLRKASSGRCARVSYLTHDGRRAPREDVALAEDLISDGHMSPFEHVATPLPDGRYVGNFKGWMQYRKTLANESDFSLVLAAKAAAA
ncbi:FAD-dependent thymidylate synthase [Sorangium sp. So ce118]